MTSERYSQWERAKRASYFLDAIWRIYWQLPKAERSVRRASRLFHVWVWYGEEVQS